MRKTILALSLVVLVCAEKYTNRYDNIDIDQILSNRRVLDRYVKCLLDKGPCTPEGKEFKKHIPDALSNNCAKCTEPQRRIIKKTSNFFRKNRPEDWNIIASHFDPEGKHKESFNKFLSEP